MPSKSQTTAAAIDEIDSTESASIETEAAEALVSRFSDTELRNVSSFDDAMALVQTRYGDVIDATEEIGSGFVMLKNKDRLVDVPFIILSFSLSESDEYKNPETGLAGHFATVMLVTEHGARYIITDGGSGIYQQLDEYAVRSGRQGGIFCRQGLRSSTYDLPDGSGKGTTHYLNV